jgi:nucleoid DNA-binding protein
MEFEVIMNKTELCKAIADESGLATKDSEKFLNSFMDVAVKTFKKGEDITLIGFGSFSVAKRSARIGRNFQTGKPINVPASKSVKFRPGEKVKDAIR